MDCLNLLLENGADMKMRDNKGESAYDKILRNDNEDLLDIFYQ
jgi:ankyrin repeat protein